MRSAITAAAEAAIVHRVFPGCSIGCIKVGEEPIYISAGAHTYDVGSPAVHERTQYDVASITKSIPTASLALALAHEGKLSLESLVRDYIPELHNDYDATIRDLLTYRVSGARLSDLKLLDSDSMLAHVFSTGFKEAPGDRAYANLPALLLGIVIERATGTNLDVLARRYFFEALHMNDTALYAGAAFAHAVPTEIDEWRGPVVGVAHDESAYVLGRSGRVSGHAGLFSCTADLLVFLTKLLESKEDIWRAIATGAEEGLGWQVSDAAFMGQFAEEKAFGKTGFTGTSVLATRGNGVALVILSNRTYPRRPQDHGAINAFRAQVSSIVYEALH